MNTLMEQRPEVDLMVVGYIDADGLSEKFGQRIKKAPFQDYVNLQLLIANVEFNLMPLQSNTFTDCKSELKYFESASVGTLSVASPGNTYRSAIQNGKNGYLSKAHDWLEVLNFAIDALPNYAEMARLARTDVLQRFIWNRFYNPIVMALGF